MSQMEVRGMEVTGMKSIVVYASRSGNTENIAYAIAAGLRLKGLVGVFAIDDAPTVLEDVGLVVIGGPTEGHSVTKSIATYLDRVGAAWKGVRVASFDTRLRWPRWLSGSAASDIAARLRACGAVLVATPTSFFVQGKQPALEPGELERAEAWAMSLVERVQPQHSAV